MRVLFAVLLLAALVSAESLKAIHKRNIMAETVSRYNSLATELTDTVGCDAVKAALLEVKAIADTTDAAADAAERDRWKAEIDTLVSTVDSVRVVKKSAKLVAEVGEVSEVEVSR